MSELRPRGRVESFQAAWIEGVYVLVERIDEYPVRKVLLELGAGAAEHDVTSGIGASPQLGQQPALSDPRRPDHLNRPRRAALERGQRGIKRVQLNGASNKL